MSIFQDAYPLDIRGDQGQCACICCGRMIVRQVANMCKDCKSNDHKAQQVARCSFSDQDPYV